MVECVMKLQFGKTAYSYSEGKKKKHLVSGIPCNLE